MANPLFNSMQQQSNSVLNLQNLKQNPMQFLIQKKFNVPQDIANDPNAIIQHLMNSGQVSQQQYNRAMQMAQKLKR